MSQIKVALYLLGLKIVDYVSGLKVKLFLLFYILPTSVSSKQLCNSCKAIPSGHFFSQYEENVQPEILISNKPVRVNI